MTECESAKKWCPVVNKHALNGMIFIRREAGGVFEQHGMCVEWPTCRKCAAGKESTACSCKTRAPDLLEKGNRT